MIAFGSAGVLLIIAFLLALAGWPKQGAVNSGAILLLPAMVLAVIAAVIVGAHLWL